MFSLGLILGGIFTASLAWLMFGGLGRAVPALVKGGILLAGASLVVLRDYGALEISLPQAPRQVPSSIFRKGVPLASLQFGFEMGTGVLTYLTSTVPYLVLVAVVLYAAHYWFALLAGIGFGLGRAIVPWLRLYSRQGERWDSLVPCRDKLIVKGCSLLALVSTLLIVTSLS